MRALTSFVLWVRGWYWRLRGHLFTWERVGRNRYVFNCACGGTVQVSGARGGPRMRIEVSTCPAGVAWMRHQQRAFPSARVHQ